MLLAQDFILGKKNFMQNTEQVLNLDRHGNRTHTPQGYQIDLWDEAQGFSTMKEAGFTHEGKRNFGLSSLISPMKEEALPIKRKKKKKKKKEKKTGLSSSLSLMKEEEFHL